MDSPPDQRLLNVGDLANMLGVSVKTVYGWVYEGIIPHIKPTRRCLRFRPADIEAWLQDRSYRPREASKTGHGRTIGGPTRKLDVT